MARLALPAPTSALVGGGRPPEPSTTEAGAIGVGLRSPPVRLALAVGLFPGVCGLTAPLAKHDTEFGKDPEPKTLRALPWRAIGGRSR